MSHSLYLFASVSIQKTHSLYLFAHSLFNSYFHMQNGLVIIFVELMPLKAKLMISSGGEEISVSIQKSHSLYLFAHSLFNSYFHMQNGLVVIFVELMPLKAKLMISSASRL